MKTNKVDVVIPTKSNFDGLFSLVDHLQNDETVEKIVVICDGEESFNYIGKKTNGKMKVFCVDLSIGIHKMWNTGIQYLIDIGNVDKGNHIAFINDDVSLADGAMLNSCIILDSMEDVGLVTPDWTGEVNDEFYEVTAFGGFCMCVKSALIKEWRFDESMKWWYGDNDIITWVVYEKDMKTGIAGKAKCWGNESKTIRNDPPKNFHQIIENDASIFHQKWDAKIAAKSAARPK